MTRILSFGRTLERMQKREAFLAEAGYTVDSAMDEAAAQRCLAAHHYDVALLGQRLSESERNQIATMVKSANPRAAVIMLYSGSIRNAELADAILNVDGEVNDLIHTIEFLVAKTAASKTAPLVIGVVSLSSALHSIAASVFA